MRIHVGVVAGNNTTRSAIVPVETKEVAPPEPGRPITYRYLVGQVEDPRGIDTEARIRELAQKLWPSDLCFFIDQSTVEGQSLYDVLRHDQTWPEALHRVHPYSGIGKQRQRLLVGILTAQAERALLFEKVPGDAEAKLVKALLSHNTEVGEDGRLTSKVDAEALVTGLALAMRLPRHRNHPEQHCTYIRRDGTEAWSRLVANDPYLNPDGTVAGSL